MRSLSFFVFLFSSFRQRFMCLVGGAERPSFPSKAVPCAQLADPLQHSARFGTFFFGGFPIPQALIQTCPQPPSSKIYALPVRRLLARWPPGLLQAVLRRDAAGPPPSTTIAVVGGILAEIPPSSSLPF